MRKAFVAIFMMDRSLTLAIHDKLYPLDDPTISLRWTPVAPFLRRFQVEDAVGTSTCSFYYWARPGSQETWPVQADFLAYVSDIAGSAYTRRRFWFILQGLRENRAVATEAFLQQAEDYARGADGGG